MRLIENNYVKATLLLVLILVAISLTNVGDVIIKTTGKVVETELKDRLLLDCSFEDTFTCRNGESPTKEQDITFVKGKIGNGIFIDANDILEYPATDNFDSTKGTIEFWVKPNWDFSAVGAHRFFYTRSDGWDFYVGTEHFNYHLYFHTRFYDIQYQIYGWKADMWHHITITWDRLETKLYMDGVFQAKEKYSIPATPPTKIYIGSENIQTNQAEAVIDEVKVYNFVRTPKQIKVAYESYFEEEEPIEERVEEDIEAELLEEEPEPVEEELSLEPEPKQETQLILNQTTLLWVFIGFLLIVVIYLLIELKRRK